MDTQQLSQGLQQAFITEGHRIVFWYDAEQSFVGDLSKLDLPDVTLINMQDQSNLAVKFKLELDDTRSKYLLYFPFAEPEAADDWLLDIKLYSRQYYADRISMIFNELGLQTMSLREHLAKRSIFLDSKARINSLKRLLTSDMQNPDTMDLAMIAVVLGEAHTDITSLVCALGEHQIKGSSGLRENPGVIRDLVRFGLLPTLLKELQKAVGYQVSQAELSGEEEFSLGHFFIRLLTTGFCEGIGDIPVWADKLAMPSVGARASARALLSRWRDSSRFYQVYDQIAQLVSSALQLDNKLQAFSMDTLAEVETFELVERQIIVELAEALPKAVPSDLQRFSQLINIRLDGYWASRHKDDALRVQYRRLYRALLAALELFQLRHKHSGGFHYASMRELYQAYCSELYLFDYHYRHYMAASQQANINLLKNLDDEVERCYANWYMDQLSRNWSERIDSENTLLDWRVSGVPNQQNFYAHSVRPQLGSSPQKRVVVIISDAFRYEAAVELQQRINEKRYSKADLSTQLGVVPSYTSLGMASLLPHQQLSYRGDGTDIVYIDGQSTAGTVQRNKILASVGGIAVTAEQVKAWSRDEGRDALRDQQLVYVYHNVIDDRSDKGGPAEAATFAHVEVAIAELTDLAHKFVSQLNTSTVLITADHGFLFQQSQLSAADRTSLVDKPEAAFKSKKRYVLGQKLPDNTAIWHGQTRHTAGTQCDTEFWIPKGANRFHFVGGARFVHGGAMPQEVAVPVLTVTQLRGSKAEQRTKSKVDVISARSTLKMVNNIHKFELMQTEAVSEFKLPVTVAVAIYDGGDIVSSEEVITFDATSDDMKERIKIARLSLLGGDFDRKKDYFLVISDKDFNTEVARYKVTIDLAYTDDFF